MVSKAPDTIIEKIVSLDAERELLKRQTISRYGSEILKTTGLQDDHAGPQVEKPLVKMHSSSSNWLISWDPDC